MYEKRRIGKTSVMVSNLSLGCAPIGNLYQQVTDQAAQDLFRYAWESGIRYIDTAPLYGHGLAEQRLGQFLKTVPSDEVQISTKVGRILRPSSTPVSSPQFVNPLQNTVHYDYSGDGIRESLESSFERLGRNYVDIVYIHDIGTDAHPPAESAAHVVDLLDTGLDALIALKDKGRIGAFGLGVNESQICLELLKEYPLDAILLAGRWTLLDRSAETELVPLCEKTGTSLVLGGIFNSGILAKGARDGATYNYLPAPEDILERVRRLEGVCTAADYTLPEAALKFALTRPQTASVLIGTSKASSLKRNLDVLNTIPDKDEFDRIFAPDGTEPTA